MKIAVSVESTHDLSKELLDKYDIKVIPYQITLGNQTFTDGEKTVQEMFEFVDKNNVLPKTTALNEYEYTEFFSSLKKEYDAVVHIALSSGFTSSCNNAIMASKNVENTYVVDSESLSTGIGLLAMYARELSDSGMDAKEVYEKVQARTKSLQVSFVIERLDYLYKGGRCNSLQLLGANLLKFRPRIVVKDGHMKSDKRYRGKMESVVSKYVEETLSEFNTPDLDKVFITCTTATDEMINVAYEQLKNKGFKNIYKTNTGVTVACHCGANTLGILYFNDGETQK